MVDDEHKDGKVDAEEAGLRPWRAREQEADDSGVFGEDFALRSETLDTTHKDVSFAKREDQHAVLIYVGSAENNFADAGQAFPLDGIGRVRFGRVPPARGLEVEANDKLLHVGLPLPWVSTVHAELSVLQSSDDGFRFHITDLGSRNGTIIEGRPQARARVLPGQVFEVGRAFWMVRVLSEREHKSYGRDTAGLGKTASPTLKKLHADLGRLADAEVSVLLVGETGTGKGHLAELMHADSGRPGPFERVNVAGMPLVRMITAKGAEGEQSDILQRARAGTVFIDEVGELSADAQARLLHLARRAGPPANGDPGPRVDVRVIAATTRDLRSMVAAGNFREDLYSCLAAYEAKIPPVRERREDLGILVRELCQQQPGMRVTSRAFRRLLAHRWPFNVRELANTLHAAVAVSDPDDTVTARGLEKVVAKGPELPDSATAIQSLRAQMIQLLMQHAGDVDAVARAVGRPGRDVVAWLRHFELRPEDYAALAR